MEYENFKCEPCSIVISNNGLEDITINHELYQTFIYTPNNSDITEEVHLSAKSDFLIFLEHILEANSKTKIFCNLNNNLVELVLNVNGIIVLKN